MTALARGLWLVVRVALWALLPFWLLVRGALELHLMLDWDPWLALGAMAPATAALLAGYAAVLSWRLTGRARFRVLATRAALPLVALFCFYALLVLPAGNAKSAAVRDGYTRIHPVLRVAVGALRVFEPDILLTDAVRTPEAYADYGLRSVSHSLHFEQRDGYVHAIDLRTLRHGATRNALVRAGFELLGFETLRHVGTADHLHVSLPRRGEPQEIPPVAGGPR